MKEKDLELIGGVQGTNRTLEERKAFVVKTFEERFEIPKCAFISVDPKDHVFYSCTCSADESSLICKECVKICHQGVGHNTSRFGKLEGTPICGCGDNHHEMEQKPNYKEDIISNENCFFKNLLRANVPRFGIKSTNNQYHCYFCQKFNESGGEEVKIDKKLVFPVQFDDYKNFDCKIIQKSGRIQLTIKFMQQLFGMNERRDKSDYERNFIRKYLMDINYNSLAVLGIGEIFAKDIIENDIAKFFKDNVNLKGELELIYPIIFSNSFFIYVQKSLLSTQLLKNARFTIPFNFFKSLSNEKLKLIMLVSKDLVMYDDDKSDLFPQLQENMANGFFIFYNTFLSEIYSFYLKYKLIMRTVTITNLTLLQRNYFCIESKKNLAKLGTEEELENFEYWLDIIPNGLIDYIERIQSFKIHTDNYFIPGLNQFTFMFFKTFKFFVKFNLIDDFTTVRFFKIVHQIFEHNLLVIHDQAAKYKQKSQEEKLKTQETKPSAEVEEDEEEQMFIMLPKLDIIIETLFLTLLYQNDKICINQLMGESDPHRRLFVFVNDNSNEMVYYAVKLYIQVLKFINYLKSIEHLPQPNKLLYEQSFNEKNLKNLYESKKINYLIKQVFELLIESKSKYNYEMKMESYSYTLGIDNVLKLSGNPFKIYLLDMPFEDPIKVQFDKIYQNLIELNTGYFNYTYSIDEYLTKFMKWSGSLFGFANTVIPKQEFDTCLETNKLPPPSKGPKAKLFRRMMKTHPFFQKFEEFIYIYSKAKKFFRQDLLSKELRSNILKFILQIIHNNIDNILLFSNMKARYFVITFYSLGKEYFNFLQILAEMIFAEENYYKMDNYFFYCELLRYTLYKLPLDSFVGSDKLDVINPDDIIDDLGFLEEQDLAYFDHKFELKKNLPELDQNEKIISEEKADPKKPKLYPVKIFTPFETLKYFGQILKVFRLFLAPFTFENIEFTELIKLVVQKIDLIEEREKVFCDYFKQDLHHFQKNEDIEEFIFNYCKFFNFVYDRDFFFFGFLTSKDDKILENLDPLNNAYLDLEQNVYLKIEIYMLYLNEESKNNFFLIGKDYAQKIMNFVSKPASIKKESQEDVEHTLDQLLMFEVMTLYSNQKQDELIIKKKTGGSTEEDIKDVESFVKLLAKLLDFLDYIIDKDFDLTYTYLNNRNDLTDIQKHDILMNYLDKLILRPLNFLKHNFIFIKNKITGNTLFSLYQQIYAIMQKIYIYYADRIQNPSESGKDANSSLLVKEVSKSVYKYKITKKDKLDLLELILEYETHPKTTNVEFFGLLLAEVLIIISNKENTPDNSDWKLSKRINKEVLNDIKTKYTEGTKKINYKDLTLVFMLGESNEIVDYGEELLKFLRKRGFLVENISKYQEKQDMNLQIKVFFSLNYLSIISNIFKKAAPAFQKIISTKWAQSSGGSKQSVSNPLLNIQIKNMLILLTNCEIFLIEKAKKGAKCNNSIQSTIVELVSSFLINSGGANDNIADLYWDNSIDVGSRCAFMILMLFELIEDNDLKNQVLIDNASDLSSVLMALYLGTDRKFLQKSNDDPDDIELKPYVYRMLLKTKNVIYSEKIFTSNLISIYTNLMSLASMIILIVREDDYVFLDKFASLFQPMLCLDLIAKLIKLLYLRYIDNLDFKSLHSDWDYLNKINEDYLKSDMLENLKKKYYYDFTDENIYNNKHFIFASKIYIYLNNLKSQNEKQCISVFRSSEDDGNMANQVIDLTDELEILDEEGIQPEQHIEKEKKKKTILRRSTTKIYPSSTIHGQNLDEMKRKYTKSLKPHEDIKYAIKFFKMLLKHVEFVFPREEPEENEEEDEDEEGEEEEDADGEEFKSEDKKRKTITANMMDKGKESGVDIIKGSSKEETLKKEEEVDGDLPLIKAFSFISNPMTNLMTKETFVKMLDDADRTNETSKINYFIGVFKDFVSEVEFYKKYVEKSPYLLSVINFDYYWVELASYLIGFIINIILICSLSKTNFLPETNYTFRTTGAYFTIVVLSLIQIKINVVAVVVYLTSKQRQINHIKMRRREEIEAKGEDAPSDYSIDPYIFVFITNILIGVIGITHIKACFIYTIQLLFIIRFSKTCNQIAQVFFDKFEPLITMLAFVIIFCFFYAMVGFYFLETEFFNGDINENQCSNMISCFIAAFNHPVRNGNGIGVIEPKRGFYQDFGLSMKRFAYDMTYFLFINILLLNMVNGVIINSFGAKREEEEQKDEDNRNKCFMCSVDRKDFQKIRVNFEKHVKESHNIKHYIEFLMNIMFKETADLEDDEIYIKEQIMDGSISVFPLGCFLGPFGTPVVPSGEDD